MARTGTIHGAVARQARIRPSATALRHGADHLSYAELDQRAGACAVELAGRGVRPGVVVPVLLPRSIELVVALLAILRCGAAYAVLDHRWPRTRVQDVIDQLSSPVVIRDPPVLRPDRAGPALPVFDDEDAPATVFFTSGTSGRPKGVVSPHRATMRLFVEWSSRLPMGRRVPQIAPGSWDAFSLELWGMLTTGGTSVIVGSDLLLPEHLRALDVDTVFLTSALFEVAVDEDIGCFAGIDTVLTGGERMSQDHARRFLLRFPATRLVNCYGPVETCVFATTHRVRPADCVSPTGVPLGLPVPHTGVHVLTGASPVSTGEAGEVCVSGPGLALGYLDALELTRQRFVTAEIDGRPRRVYRTGDRGLVDEHGILHFLGRYDRQLKIAGNRVEPAELEAVSERVPGVRRCRAVPQRTADGRTAGLVLFYVSDFATPTPSALRRHLAARLPPHLVPRVVRRIDSFPVTASGKVDTQALLEL